MLLADFRQNPSLDLAGNPMGHDCDPSAMPCEATGATVRASDVTGAFLDDLFFAAD
jgi:hypothetical protein